MPSKTAISRLVRQLDVTGVSEVWRLAERGANVGFRDSRGMTARQYMMRKRSAREHFEALARFE